MLLYGRGRFCYRSWRRMSASQIATLRCRGTCQRREERRVTWRGGMREGLRYANPARKEEMPFATVAGCRPLHSPGRSNGERHPPAIQSKYSKYSELVSMVSMGNIVYIVSIVSVVRNSHPPATRCGCMACMRSDLDLRVRLCTRLPHGAAEWRFFFSRCSPRLLFFSALRLVWSWGWG